MLCAASSTEIKKKSFHCKFLSQNLWFKDINSLVYKLYTHIYIILLLIFSLHTSSFKLYVDILPVYTCILISTKLCFIISWMTDAVWSIGFKSEVVYGPDLNVCGYITVPELVLLKVFHTCM